MSDDKKPTRRVSVSYKGHSATIHWARYVFVGPDYPGLSDTDRILYSGHKEWVPACNMKFNRFARSIPAKGPKYRVTCAACVKKWGTGVK